jgi:hypothetical protein
MIDPIVRERIEGAIASAIESGLKMNFHSWHKFFLKGQENLFFQGAQFISFDKDKKIVSCCPLGALLIKNGIKDCSYANAARLLGVSDDWVICFMWGWQNCKANREYFDSEVFDYGASLREILC